MGEKIVLNGKISRILNAQTESVVEFIVKDYRVKYLDDLDKNKLYSIEIKEAASKKSQNQNRAAWLIMSDIAKKEDVMPDVNLVYLRLLKMANIKTMTLLVNDYDFISDDEVSDGKLRLTDDELIKKLQSVYRVVVIRDRSINEKGNHVSVVQVALGMSHFTKEQMADFIDRLLYYAEQRGIDTSDYYFGG